MPTHCGSLSYNKVQAQPDGDVKVGNLRSSSSKTGEDDAWDARRLHSGPGIDLSRGVWSGPWDSLVVPMYEEAEPSGESNWSLKNVLLMAFFCRTIP